MDDKLLILNREALPSPFGEVCDDIGFTGVEGFRGRSRDVAFYDAAPNLPSQVHIHVSVQSLTMESKPGFLDFFPSQHNTQRFALERHTIEISEQNPTHDIPHLLDAIATFREIAQLHHSRSQIESSPRLEFLDAYGQKDHQLSKSHTKGLGALSIWV